MTDMKLSICCGCFSGSVCLAFVSHANLKLEGNPDSGCGVSGSGAAVIEGYYLLCRYDGSILVIYRNFVPCHQTGHSAGKKRLLYLAADGLPDGKRGDRLYCQQYSAGTAWLFIVGWGKISEALLLPQIKITGHGPCHRRAVQPTLFTAFSCGLVSLWEYW